MYKILKIALKPSCPRSYYAPALGLAPLQSTTLPPPLLPSLIPSPGGQAGQTEKWRLCNKLRKMESFHYNSDNPDPFFSAPEPFLPAAVSHHQAHPRSLQLVGKQISKVLIWSNQNQSWLFWSNKNQPYLQQPAQFLPTPRPLQHSPSPSPYSVLLGK